MAERGAALNDRAARHRPAGVGSPRAAPDWQQATLASYEQLSLGYLAVLRQKDGALIGRGGLMELVVESAEPEPGIRRGWFRLTGAPADVELTFECELGCTFDPVVWGQSAGRRVAFATERATFCGCRTWSRPFDAACCYQVTCPDTARGSGRRHAPRERCAMPTLERLP